MFLLNAAGPKGQRLQVFLLFCFAYCNAAAYLVARTVADSEFLSRFGSERLPELYLLSAGVVTLSSIIYGNRLRAYGLKRTVVSTLVLFSLSSILLAQLMGMKQAPIEIFAIAYLLTQVRGSLGTIQFATLLNEQFAKSGPVKVVGIVGAGATFAGLTMGSLISYLPDSVAVESLMYGVAAIDLVTLVPLLALRILRRKQSNAPENTSAESLARSDGEPSLLQVITKTYVILITAIVACGIMATTLVEFEWKATAAEELEYDMSRIARFFGLFYGVVYGLTGLTQLLFTARILRKSNLLMGLLVYPASLGGCVAHTLIFPPGAMLGALSLCKGTDVFRRSIYDPTLQVLYSPLDTDFRRQAITFVGGIAKPFAEALAALQILILSVYMAPAQMHYYAFPWLVCSLLLSVPTWKRYRSKKAKVAVPLENQLRTES